MADDWVIKGCHIHVNGVELTVVSDHNARVDFKEVFSMTPSDRLEKAIKYAREHCLPDPAMRRRWIDRLDMARAYMLGYDGGEELASRANGRMFEFKMLRIAIERWEQTYGNN
ncbi:hypothetical protein R0290_21120 [Burkholderia semiarida]|uniref:hypothetical protein n=1 Tax=Burkholderia TaxID=32008 RepID=UPI001CF363DE|nr:MULTISPECIES: hypothetical protein [Burkholderia]MCA8300854.1 hypothetical protein [Burkholderia seminalis]MDN7698616.1 hypothetical protein [Burkholderia sp. AU44665]